MVNKDWFLRKYEEFKKMSMFQGNVVCFLFFDGSRVSIKLLQLLRCEDNQQYYYDVGEVCLPASLDPLSYGKGDLFTKVSSRKAVPLFIAREHYAIKLIRHWNELSREVLLWLKGAKNFRYKAPVWEKHGIPSNNTPYIETMWACSSLIEEVCAYWSSTVTNNLKDEIEDLEQEIHSMDRKKDRLLSQLQELKEKVPNLLFEEVLECQRKQLL